MGHSSDKPADPHGPAPHVSGAGTPARPPLTDDTIIRVPVYIHDVQPHSDTDGSGDGSDEAAARPQQQGWFKRRFGRKTERKDDMVLLRMTRRDYLRFATRNEAGAYVGTEPWSIARGVLWDMVEDARAGRGTQVPDRAVPLRERLKASSEVTSGALIGAGAAGLSF